jgi:hypothetical protein
MNLELDDEQTRALLNVLLEAIDADRYPLSPRSVKLGGDAAFPFHGGTSHTQYNLDQDQIRVRNRNHERRVRPKIELRAGDCPGPQRHAERRDSGRQRGLRSRLAE